MDEKQVVKLFLDEGFQISKSALPLILQDPEKTLTELKKMKPRPFIISEAHVKNIQDKIKIKKPKIEIVKEYRPKKKLIRVGDYIDHFLSRYEKLREIILKRMEEEKLMSISKIGQSPKFSIIGVVREKSENNILVEDPTGEIYVFFDDFSREKLKEILLDDVLGIVAKKVKDKYYVKKIFFPDIPANREIKRTEDEVLLAVVVNPEELEESKYQNLLSSLSGINPSFSIVFLNSMNKKVMDDFSRFNSLNIVPTSYPTLFLLENIKILVMHRSFFSTLTFGAEDIPISILKRRHIFSAFYPEIHVGSDDFVLSEIPDIFVSNFGTVNKNYKGTTIIFNSDSSRLFLIDLKTREVKEKSF